VFSIDFRNSIAFLAEASVKLGLYDIIVKIIGDFGFIDLAKEVS